MLEQLLMQVFVPDTTQVCMFSSVCLVPCRPVCHIWVLLSVYTLEVSVRRDELAGKSRGACLLARSMTLFPI